MTVNHRLSLKQHKYLTIGKQSPTQLAKYLLQNKQNTVSSSSEERSQDGRLHQ